jgi:hypothetical protein
LDIVEYSTQCVASACAWELVAGLPRPRLFPLASWAKLKVSGTDPYSSLVHKTKDWQFFLYCMYLYGNGYLSFSFSDSVWWPLWSRQLILAHPHCCLTYIWIFPIVSLKEDSNISATVYILNHMFFKLKIIPTDEQHMSGKMEKSPVKYLTTSCCFISLVENIKINTFLCFLLCFQQYM